MTDPAPTLEFKARYDSAAKAQVTLTANAVEVTSKDRWAVWPYASIAAVRGSQGVLTGKLVLTVGGHLEELDNVEPNDLVPDIVRRIADAILGTPTT